MSEKVRQLVLFFVFHWRIFFSILQWGTGFHLFPLFFASAPSSVLSALRCHFPLSNILLSFRLFTFPTSRFLISHYPLSHFPLPTPTSRAHLSHRRRASSGTPDTIISSSSPEFGVNNQASNQPSPGAKMKRVISDKRTPTAPYPTSSVYKSYLPVGCFT